MFGFDPEQIWITVFAGDDELGIGPTRRRSTPGSRSACRASGSSSAGGADNFWQMGPTGPCGPCSELYLDRGLEFGKPDDLPGGENERFLEYWNLVFMQYDQNPVGTLTPLPAQNIDTGLGLNRLAAILQGKETVFETDQFAPLIELGEELSGRRYGHDGYPTDRALRILADHSRAMTFLIADGVVPSNEDRGYVLRRIIRRAILQGRHTLGLDPGFLGRYAELVTELMGGALRRAAAAARARPALAAGRGGGLRAHARPGSKLLDELIARARDTGAEGIAGADAFLLHDTYGFPIDLTLELVAEHDLGVDEEGFEVLMDEQRTRARASAGRGRAGERAARARAGARPGRLPDRLRGLRDDRARDDRGGRWRRERTAAGQARGIAVLRHRRWSGRRRGLGRVPDGDCRARVEDVVRLGDDQVVALVPERGVLEPGERVRARVDRLARHATECNHTATHLLHAALRSRLGEHVHQAGSYVGPDKLRFDFTHGSGLSAEELAEVEDAVNGWVLESHPVRALTTTLDEAKRLGAMALFGEKYGDIVRMVEVGDGSFSRELCGGTHVRTTAEIGVFKVLSRELERGQRAADRGGDRPGGGGAAARATTPSWPRRRTTARPGRAGGRGRARAAWRGCGRLEKAAKAAGGGAVGRPRRAARRRRGSTAHRCSPPRSPAAATARR